MLVFSFIVTVGCTTTPNRYGQQIKVISGPYKGLYGVLIGDCSGFENYRVELYDKGLRCIKVWDMEGR